MKLEFGQFAKCGDELGAEVRLSPSTYAPTLYLANYAAHDLSVLVGSEQINLEANGFATVHLERSSVEVSVIRE